MLPKELTKSLIDLANIAKGMRDENQQSSVQQEIERLSPSTAGKGRGGESRELNIRLVLVNHLPLQKLIQIPVLQHRLSQKGRLKK